jgi:hypothetical protein
VIQPKTAPACCHSSTTAAAGQPGSCSGGCADARPGLSDKATTASAAPNNQFVAQRFIDRHLFGHLAESPGVLVGQVFLATLKGEVLHVDSSKDKINKTYKVGSPIRFQPAIDLERIYVGTQDGKIVCINTGNAEFTGWSTWGARWRAEFRVDYMVASCLGRNRHESVGLPNSTLSVESLSEAVL